MRINTEAGTSEDPRSIISGSHDEYLRVNEIAINFIKTVESYDCKSIIVNYYFSKQIANILEIDSDPKSLSKLQISLKSIQILSL